MRPVVSIRLDQNLLVAARRRAKQQRRSLTNYIECLVAGDVHGEGPAGPSSPSPPLRGLDRVMNILRSHQPELRGMGVLHAGVYGSVARGEETAASDIDILIEGDRAKMSDILAYGGVSEALQRWIGGDIDVKDKAWLKPDLLERVMTDHVIAF